MARKSGILLPITSLPSDYGIGDFGKGAQYFVNFIADMGYKVWQVLPILLVGMGNSPYSGDSAFAGNFMLIDITDLPKNLLNQEEIDKAKYSGSIYKVDYDYARTVKKDLIKLAYSRMSASDREHIYEFAQKNSYWLQDYAIYMAIKEQNLFKPWRSWEEKLARHNKAALAQFAKDNAQAIEYYYFEQYLFNMQWHKLKAYANKKGVEIFGDMPIYVANESVDIWAHPHMFQLDSTLMPTRVAGVPPDYFSADGQLWNNPLYDYDKMAEDNYDWWINRIKHNLELYDMLRIDHFRGLCEYWSVEAGAPNAKNGKWVKGPQMSLFDELKKQCPNANIIAEDLGIIDDKVVKLLEETHFDGMKVLQFAFDGSGTNLHLPHNYSSNCVAYTATHDNNTTLGWLYELDTATRNNVLAYINCGTEHWANGGSKCESTRAAIRTVVASVANLAIIPLQDLCGYGADTRTNIPGVAQGNWEYRTTYSALSDIDKDYFLFINKLYNRI